MAQNDRAVAGVLAKLCRATLAVAEATDLDHILQRIVDVARELVGAEFAAIGLTAAAGELETFVASGLPEGIRAQMGPQPQGKGLLGQVLERRKPLRLHEIKDSPAAVGFPEGHPPMTSFLGVPVVNDKQVVGSLYLTNKNGAAGFTLLDEKLVESLAAHAAVAIKKAQLLASNEANADALSRRNRQLSALSNAVISIAEELALDRVLQQIVEAARDLAGAEFAALGIPNAVGYLESFVHVGMKPETVSRIPSLPQGRGLLGVIIQERRSVRLANLQEDPRAYGFPPGHPPMTSFLGVPIMAGHDTLGNLYLTNKRQALEFSPEDQEIVELLASHAAIAIQNARLYEQVGRLAILEERTRIGMDLHDGVIQSIYAVGLTLESVRLALPEDDADAHQLLGYAVDGLNDAIRDIRNFILDLRPHRFTGDLAEGLGRLVREFRANTMIEVDFESLTAATAELSPASARAIFLTAQSALANVARHARAGRVAIALERQDNEVTLRIQDDGQGFDPGRQRETVGHGLSNMRARAEELEGRFQVQSAPGAGTTIQLTLPFR